MADGNWGALATGEGDYLTDFWLNTPDYLNDPRFTLFGLKDWVHNQQPAHISALANQFTRAYDLLVEIERTVRDQSVKLYGEAWTNSAAREAFMERGPGKVLAYLQDWQSNILRNRDALRALVGPIRRSQAEMEDLVRRYDGAIASAGDRNNLSFGDRVNAADPQWWEGVGLVAFKMFNDDNVDAYLIQRVQKVKDYFDQEARKIVHRLSTAYHDAWWHMWSGLGATYSPPNVTMMPPGQKFVLPPGAPAPPGFAGGPPAAPVLTPPALGVQPPVPAAVPIAPGVPVLPKAPLAPTAPSVAGAKLPAGAPALPGGPPGAPALLPGALPAGLPTGFRPGAGPGAVPGTGSTAGLGGLAPPAPTGLTKGVLRNPGAAGLPGVVPPPAAGRRRRDGGPTLRSPAAYTATGTGAGAPSALPPPAGRTGRTGRPATGPGTPSPSSGPGAAVPDAFSRNTLPPPVSPVLGRPAPRREAGDPPRPAGTRGTFLPPDAVPPVLDARTARPPAGGLSLPPGGIPPQRPRRRSATPGGTAHEPQLAGNPDWLSETAPGEPGVAAPVLRNQAMPVPVDPDERVAGPVPPGATAPVLGRPRDAVREALARNRSRPGAPRPPVEADLTRRSLAADRPGVPATEEPAPAREGEEAFTVQTPGGPVVGTAPPAPPPEEPKPTVGNG